jgi:hypothetical protein
MGFSTATRQMCRMTIATVILVLGVLSLVPKAHASLPGNPGGDIACKRGAGWCTASADRLPGHTGWAQMTGTGAKKHAQGYKWDGFRWVATPIQTKNRWFILSQNTRDWSVLRTYDTNVWVAVKPNIVTLWLPESYVTRTFLHGGCEVVGPDGAPTAPTCFYRSPLSITFR